MGLPGQSFFRFLLRRALQPTFSSIFHRFLIKKSMFFSLLFSSHPCFFLDMATFTIVWLFLIETHFFIFFCVFFSKNAFFLFLLKKMKKCVNEPNFLIIVFKNNCFFKKKKLKTKNFRPKFRPLAVGGIGFFLKI